MQKSTWFILFCTAILTACSPSDSNTQNTDSTLEKVVEKAIPEAKLNEYKEKWDIIEISKASQIYSIAETEQKEKEWNQRMAAAQSVAEQQQVFREQAAHFRERENALAAKQMKSEKGKIIQQAMLNNLRNIRMILEKIAVVDLNSAQGKVIINEFEQKMPHYAQDAIQALQDYHAFARTHGFDLSQENKEKLDKKLQELKEILQ